MTTTTAPAVNDQLHDRLGLTALRVDDVFHACALDAKRRVFKAYRVAIVSTGGQLLGVNVRTGKERSFTPHQLADTRRYDSDGMVALP